ncbi:MAG TPA: hypothetical protein P5514_14900 [Bacteroidales bacterium]|nr:hypothetical protein [Bacteroidales bacterium]
MEGIKIITNIANWLHPKFKFLESILISMILIGILLKILHIDYGKYILMVSLHITSVLYFINSFAIKHLPRNNGIANFINRLLGITCSLLFLGIIFTINHYAGTRQILTISIGTLIVLIPISIFSLIKNKDSLDFYRSIVIKSVVYSIIGLILILTSSETLNKFGIARQEEIKLKTEQQCITAPILHAAQPVIKTRNCKFGNHENQQT